MKHLSLVLPEGRYNLTSIIMPYEMFNRANEVFARKGKAPVFQIQVVGAAAKAGIHNDTFLVQPDTSFENLDRSDLVLLTAFANDYEKGIKENKTLVEWVRRQYTRGAEVGSLCTGAFLLAATGLLDGKECSTHWKAVNEFRRLFPDVILRDEKVITEHNGLYTTGGALSSMNLVIHLIEKHYDRETAIYCGKTMQLDMNRGSQSPFAIFEGQKNHSDLLVKNAQVFIEENATMKISVESLADKFSIGRRHFERRFKEATGNTPMEYIQRVKIELAKKTLETGRENINEVMYSVGYSDVAAFRNMFKKITGLTPMEYRSRYNKEAA
jgi:transcriptional regulator GlxA family with amidase domain